LTSHIPDHTKPGGKGQPAVLKDRPGSHRNLTPTFGAQQKPSLRRPTLATTTPRAHKALRPAQSEQILPTGFVCRKPLFKFSQGPWVVLHAYPYYPSYMVESNG
jgi:hypothetical protein